MLWGWLQTVWPALTGVAGIAGVGGLMWRRRRPRSAERDQAPEGNSEPARLLLPQTGGGLIGLVRALTARRVALRATESGRTPVQVEQYTRLAAVIMRPELVTAEPLSAGQGVVLELLRAQVAAASSMELERIVPPVDGAAGVLDAAPMLLLSGGQPAQQAHEPRSASDADPVPALPLSEATEDTGESICQLVVNRRCRTDSWTEFVLV